MRFPFVKIGKIVEGVGNFFLEGRPELFRYVKFEMPLRHLSGNVKWAFDYIGLKFQERYLGRLYKFGHQ